MAGKKYSAAERKAFSAGCRCGAIKAKQSKKSVSKNKVRKGVKK